jgi:aflatoxin B1 aldehyde reductase
MISWSRARHWDGLMEAECALRWMTHHLLLKREFGEGIIIGASSP